MADLGLENPKGARSWQQIADLHRRKPKVKKESNRYWQIDVLKFIAMFHFICYFLQIEICKQ